MTVYHGSYMLISFIDLSKCEKHKDFGQGFYVTKYLGQAEDWAARIGRKHHTEGVVTTFEFFESAFSSWNYRVLRFDDYSEEWLDFIVLNRNPRNENQAHDYDIVEGPVANDKIQQRLDKYLKGKISKEFFLNELRHHEPTHQICFCSQRALLMLEHKADSDTDLLFNMEDIGEAIIESLMLDNQIDETEATKLFFSSDIFVRLSEKESKLYLKPWQHIYSMLKEELSQK